MQLLVYPTKDASTGEILAMDSVAVGAHQRKLFEWLCENGSIEPVREYDPAQLHITPAEVLRLIQAGDPAWRGMVPAPVADLIAERGLFSAMAA